MSELLLDREGLVQDTQATLREVAGILHDLWDLQGGEEPDEMLRNGFLGHRRFRSNVETVMANTRQEVLELRKGITALKDLLPYAFFEADHPRSQGLGLESARGRRLTRASEILLEVQERLDKLAHKLEHQSPGGE